MEESFIRKVGDLTTIDLINHLVILNDKAPDDVAIYDLEEELINVTLTKSEVLYIFSIPKESKFSYLKPRKGIRIKLNANWIIIKEYQKEIAIRPEMFDKIGEYIITEYQEKGAN